MKQKLTAAIAWSFLDNLNEGVLVVRPDGTLEHINEAARAQLGLNGRYTSLAQVNQVVAPNQSWRKLLHPPATTQLSIATQTLNLTSKRWRGPDSEYVQILLQDQQPLSSPATAYGSVDHLAALTRISSEPDFDKKLQLIVDGLQVTGWNRVALSLRDEAFNPTKIITAGFTEEERRFLKENMLPAATWRKLFNDEKFQEFRRGSCYFVPEGRWSRENVGAILPDNPATVGNNDENAWHPEDLLCVPLFDRQQKMIGLLGLDQPVNGRRPDARTLQTIEPYAQYASSVIENAQLFNEALERSQELEMLIESSHALSSTLEKETVLSLMGKHMLRAISADGFTIYQWHEDTEQLEILEDLATINHNRIFAAGTSFTAADVDEPIRQALRDQQPRILTVGPGDDFTPRPQWIESAWEFTVALLPLVLSEEIFGLVEIVTRGSQQIKEQDLQFLVALSKQAATALETALIFEDTYERERFYNALGSVSMAINYTVDLQNVLTLICRESIRIFDVDGAYIWQRKDGQFVGSAAKGHGEATFIDTTASPNETDVFVTQIACSGQATFANNLSRNDNVRLKLPESDSIQAALGVPLEQEGEIIGVLILVDKQEPYRFTTKDINRATIFGVQAANALQNAELFAELRLLNEELDARVAKRTQALHEESTRVKILLRITTELSASLDQDRVLSRALELVKAVVNATQGVILLIDQETGELVFRAAIGTDREPSPKGLPSGMMQDEGLAGWIITNRSPVIVHDTKEDPRWVERETSKDHRSVLAVPLITSEEVIGVLMLFHNRPNAFTMQQLDLVEAAAIQVANAINNANLYLLIRDQAERLGTMLRLEQIETAKNQAMLESIADGVVVADAQHKIILANMPASSILEIERDQLIDKSINELLGLYALADQSWVPVIEDWANNADRIERWTYLEERLTIEDKVINVRVSPVLVGNQFFGTVSIFRDITKEVEVDRLKSEFVSTVSHELRTPMTSIKGYVDLLLMGAAGGMSDPQTRYLKVIKNNAERLHMLVNDLLNISRIETGRISLDLRPVDVSDLVKQVVDVHLRGRIQHEEKGIQVTTTLPDSLPLVNADHGRITQVLTNLLDNALNYTPEGGEICVEAETKANYVYLSVTDTGIGISEDNLGKIFDRFFRAEDSEVQQVPGTGLGLAIVHSIVEMHGGRLKVDSALGEGSTFTFNLPVVVEDSEPA